MLTSQQASSSSDAFLSSLLRPEGAYSRPADVLADSDLTHYEKRAILASWASDAAAVESAPALRLAPAGQPVTIDEIMDALRLLDRQLEDQCRSRKGAEWNRTSL
jgi:hypothetical protein